MLSYVGSVIFVFAGANLVFYFAVKMKRNDLADVVWGPGFLLAIIGAVVGRLIQDGSIHLALIDISAIACVALWASRLSYHIGKRFFSHHQEDARYLNWRRQWGSGWKLRSYLQVFLLQAFFLLVIATPLLVSIASAPNRFSLIAFIGISVWLGGFVFESIADRQLRIFQSIPTNKGKIMDQGVWSWSRHPNYFGEVLQWWGIFLLTFQPTSWWTIISPITLTFLILKVSGIPMLEKLMESRPGFAEYKRKTSVFVPLPPKQN